MTSDSENNQEEIKKEEQVFTLAEFLESHPPNQTAKIRDLVEYKYTHPGFYEHFLNSPQVLIHCSHDSCNGERFFRCVDQGKIKVLPKDYKFIYSTYRCYNCLETEKTFALAVIANGEDSTEGHCYKFGELPNFGPPTPAKLIKLIGPDREEFLKGRRCENQGLGVGAFIYYRRVVETQKNRILQEIVKVSEKIGAKQEQIDLLKSAIDETQFSKALDMAKNAIPESLLINGHSPLGLLHGALSEGVHALSDEECLTLASSVRVVLAELSDRLGQALKDEAELANALNRLLNKKG